MKLHKLFFIVLILFASFQNSFGQNSEEPQFLDNWLRAYNIYYTGDGIYHRFDQYSKEDIKKIREKLELFKASKGADEWEGRYSPGGYDPTGISYLQLNFNVGFVDLYVDTCNPELRSVNYGKIKNSADIIQTVPEFVENSPRKSSPVRYVKVKWGESHYLVEESALLAFAEKAVGLYVEPEDASDKDFQKWSNYWTDADLEKSSVGLPVFPNAYKKFQRLPIEGRIISVGKRTIEKEKDFGDIFYNADAAYYAITINAGKDKGVKNSMIFETPGADTPILITQVNQNTAIGLIHRDIDEKKRDACFDENMKKTACPKIKVASKTKTAVGKFGLSF